MRNRNSLIRERHEAFRDARLIVIASEGKDTERIYFKALAKECAQDDYMHVALSNPCFELWLLLHLADVTLLTPEEQQQWMENRRKSKNADPYLKVLLRQEMGSYHEAGYAVRCFI